MSVLPVTAAPTNGRAAPLPPRVVNPSAVPIVSTDSRVGTNLGDIGPGTGTGVVFVDAMKQAAPWSSTGPLKLDPDGNVALLARGQVAATVIYPSEIYPAGDYTLLYDGTATFEVDPASGTVVQRSPGRMVIRIVPRFGYGIHLRLTSTDGARYAHNIRLILPGFEKSYATAPFHPLFLQALRRFNVLRFKDWMHADRYIENAVWPLRPTTDRFTQAGPDGVAVEYMIALANATSADPWFTLPVGATDLYIYSFAQLVHQRLDRRLHPIFEYGHEVWKLGTPANVYATAAGRNFHLANDPTMAALDWYSVRSVQIFDLVARAFGNDAGRVGRVLSGPLASPNTPEAAVDRAILSYAGAAGHVNAFAVAADDDGIPNVTSPFTAARMTPADVVNALEAGLSRSSPLSGGITGTLMLAQAAHLPLIAYEGGPDLQPAPPAVGTATLATLLATAGRSAAMRQVYRDALEAWHTLGGGLFVAKNFVALPSLSTGSPGIIERVDQPVTTAYKLLGVADYQARHPTPRLQPSPNVTVTPTGAVKTALAALSGAPQYIDAGGPAAGSYVADTNFTGGFVSRGTTKPIDTSAISNPAPQTVYQTGRVSNFSYKLTGLTAGAAYTVRLHFVEYIYNSPGQRQFNVSINGKQVLTNFDIYQAAGYMNKAIALPFPTAADSTGAITIQFTDVIDHSIVQGIELQAGTMPNVPQFIDAGGPLANLYQADTGFTGGSVSAGTSATIDTSLVSAPAPLKAYQTGRYGNFSYNLRGLSPGTTYTVRLHFAEYYFCSAGARIFGVSVNGTQVLKNFDIYKTVGAKNKAITESFPATADPNGNIALAFTSVVNNAIVQGIELENAIPAPADYLTYHSDNQRTGWNKNETHLTTSNVSSVAFGLRYTVNLDGNVMAQPLFVGQYPVPGLGTHNIAIVVTEHNTVYALDADNGVMLWQHNLGQSQASTDVSNGHGCMDISPEYGITGTPVIVRTSNSSGTIYVVAATEPTTGTFQTWLHALDLGTGQDQLTPVLINPSVIMSNGSTASFSPSNQMNRTSLVWANGSLYAGFGSHCDLDQNVTHGWLVQYNSSLQQIAVFNTAEDVTSNYLDSIWMSGFASMVDASGNVYFVTGNGAYDANTTGKNYGESVVKLSPSLSSVQGFFTPNNWSTLNSNDADFGSGGIMLLPPQTGSSVLNVAVAMGKDAKSFLLNADNLGGQNNANALQVLQVGVGSFGANGNGVWGGPAYYQAPNGQQYVYYETDSDVLRAYALSTGSTQQLTQSSTGSSIGGEGGATPIVSSNGNAGATGIVWVIQRPTDISNALTMQAYDATNLGTLLFNGNAGSWANAGHNAFLTPLVANGKVYTGTSSQLLVFGLSGITQ